MKLEKKFVFIFAALFVLIGVGCSKGKTVAFETDGYDKVFSITESTISRDAVITVKLAEDIQTSSIESCMSLSNAKKGSWQLVDERTVSFTPESPYDQNTTFDLAVDVGKLLGGKAGKVGIVRKFCVIPAKFAVELGYPKMQGSNETAYDIDITVETDVAMTTEEVGKALSAVIDNETVGIGFTPSSEKVKQHSFKISGIARKEKSRTLYLKYNAVSLGFGLTAVGQMDRVLPALDKFEIINVQSTSDRCVQFLFSEVLDDSVDLREFISVTATDYDFTYRWNIDGNALNVLCSRDEWPDDTTIYVYPNFKSSRGHTLEKGETYKVFVGWEKPTISFTDNTVIIPAEGKPTVAVNTKNVSGIIIEAVQIQRSNILQFLQVNTLSGSDEIYRVGESVWRKSFDFPWTDDMKNKTVTRGLDLTELVKKYPDGMFQLKITFAKRHSRYQSSSAMPNNQLEFPSDFVNFADNSYDAYWDSIGSRNGQYDFWDYRDNPNHPAYYIASYHSDILCKKNVLVSNLALSAKVDTSGKTYITAINLLTSQPETNVEIKVFSYAQKLLEQGQTNAQGSYTVQAPRNDFSFIQAKSGNNYAYLAMNQWNSALNISNFQVDGIRTVEGLKGFIYGERGVWRPGDPLHLCLILQDAQHSLPENTPVVFTLENPLGTLCDKQVLTESVGGFYKITTDTKPDDVTGTWLAKFKVGNSEWTKQVKIESVIPNKLAVEMSVDGGFFTSGSNSVKVKGQWLTGFSGSNLKTELYARYVSDNKPFDGYENYVFNNSEYTTHTTLSKVWSGTLDENGEANVSLQLDAGKNVSGRLNAVFETRIYEPSGAYSIENKSFTYSPFSSYVGMLMPKSDDEYRTVFYLDKDHNIDFVVLDENGKQVSGSTELEFKIYELDWRWWWVQDAYTKASYDESRGATLVSQKSVYAKNGKASVSFNLDHWGRYLFVVTDVESGHSASSIEYADYSYWATRNATDVSGSATMLVLTGNQDTYNAGEDAAVTFSANKDATAYITIEKNGAILKQDAVKTVDGTNTYSFKTDTGMCPNVYVHISLVQSYAASSNSLPVRLYGILPIMIEDSKTKLEPVFSVADSFAPNQNCTISVSEKNGQATTMTVAVVDEGLLGLTAYKTPNPWNYFYSKESSQLASYDVFDLVSGSLKGELQTIITVGGSDAALQLANKKAERFKPVVQYFGPFALKKGEKKQLQFTMPEYIGQVRLMAVCGSDTGFGAAEKKVPVKSDIMLAPTLPRTLGVGEEMNIPVTVFNTTDSAKNVSVKMTAEGSTKAAQTLSVKLPPQSNDTVFFNLKTDTAGTTAITFDASIGGKSTAHSKTEIAVKSRGTPHEEVFMLAVEQGKTAEQNIQTIGENGTKNLAVEICKVQPIGIEKNLSYLLEYPHGCIEQITSKAFAQLYIDKLLNLSPSAISDVHKNIESVIQRYPTYQLSSGGFAYWQGDTYEYEWASCYVLHFLTEAKRAGYAVDDDMYNRVLSRVQNTAATITLTDDPYMTAVQSYRLYCLALVGKANVGAMNRLSAKKDLSVYARSLLSLAYVLSGNEQQGQKIFNSISADFPSYRYTGGVFSSTVRDMAVAAMAAKHINHNSAAARFTALSQIVNKRSWLSTQEAAWVLLAASRFFNKQGNDTIKYKLVSDGVKIENTLKDIAITHDIPVDGTTKKVSITNSSGNTFFATLRYTSKVYPGTEIKTQSGLAANVSYIRNGTTVDPAALKLGDTFETKIQVSSTGKTDIDNVVLTFPIPTGWEISNERLTDVKTAKNYSYMDIKDDVVYVYFDLEYNKPLTFNFNCTATYSGTYFIPAVTCAAMYDDGIKSISVGKKITIGK